ncbi:hypothetical protein GEZ23_17600 [Vibrio parahaemolyticus]|nr:hypothetical protein [Vibrio parahaemolyticus]EGQ9146585.1 hypothetical protein [Vibrio parahaemolyticus]
MVLVYGHLQPTIEHSYLLLIDETIRFFCA